MREIIPFCTRMLCFHIQPPPEAFYLHLPPTANRFSSASPPLPFRSVQEKKIAGQTAAGAARSSERPRQQSQICGGTSSISKTVNTGSR